MAHNTREGWLIAAAKLLTATFFDGRELKVPAKIQYSCGFPRGRAKAISQCWDPVASYDGTTHIFICPSQDDPLRVLGVLLHEMVHAVVGIKEKHGGAFKKVAREIGLEGKLTATYVSPGTPLHAQLCIIAEQLGPYPHAAMGKSMPKPDKDKDGDGDEGERKRTWSYYLSKKEPKFKLSVSHKVVENYGLPRDPWGEEMYREGEEPEVKEGDE